MTESGTDLPETPPDTDQPIEPATTQRPAAFSVMSVFAKTWRIIDRHGRLLFALALVFAAIDFLFRHVLAQRLGLPPLVNQGIRACIDGVGAGSMTAAVLFLRTTGTARFADCLGKAGKRAVTLSALTLLIALLSGAPYHVIMAIGVKFSSFELLLLYFSCLVYTYLITTFMFLATPGCIAENLGILASAKRSLTLARRCFAKLFGVIFLGSAISGVGGVLLVFVFIRLDKAIGIEHMGWLASGWRLIAAYVSVFAATFYFELVAGTEGRHDENFAKVFE